MARKRTADRRLYDELSAAVEAQRTVVARSRIDAWLHLDAQVRSIERVVLPAALSVDDHLASLIDGLFS